MADHQPPPPPEPDPPPPLQLSYHTPQKDLREAWEGSISPFAKLFVTLLLVVLFGGSLLAMLLLFLALLGR